MKSQLLFMLGAFLLALLTTYLLEKKFIPYLMRIKMGQTILEIGPRWHKNKEGTPTMGGLFFMGGITVAFLAFCLPNVIRTGDLMPVKILCMMLLFGAVGFIDDFVKFVKKRNKGLSAMQKLVLQFAIAGAFLFAARDSLTTSLALPFTDFRLELGAFYWVLALLFLVYMVNAVNITDGIDGLASGVTLVVFLFFAALSAKLLNLGQGIISASVCGGMVGFLIYNFHPARIFMGDTGSLFLGGAVAGMGFWLDMPLLIAVVGFIYLWEALSVVIQVLCYKLTKKRVFRMAPFHHHLEMGGWRENRIVAVFSLITAVLCAAGFIAFF